MKAKPPEVYIGDLVCIKKEIQKLIGIKDWGIVLEETTILPVDLPDEHLEPIESWVIFFPAQDESLTIPKNCVTKITILEE